ncbi:MAG TPA: hypothetical protein PLK08_02460 [Phycisphaerae bacterium]|nr:hypothetical protein [Phycisphaerae bacterium]
MNNKLQMLRNKYDVKDDGVILDGSILKLTGGQCVRLLPWRVERRFIELKKIIEAKTLEDVSTLRFAVMSSSESLKDLLFREFDLCEFLGASRIVRAFAVMNGDDVANILVKLADGKSCSIECSAALPAGTERLDRHEIIARRGVACDRTVDTQVPQSSIYVFGKELETHYTDTDAELFGLCELEILLVRSAMQILQTQALAVEWNAATERIEKIIDKTLQNADRQPAFFEEA